MDSLLHAMEGIGLDTTLLSRGLPGVPTASPIRGRRIEIGAVRRLYHRADRMANDPLLGVRLGKGIDDGAIGFLGVLLWHAADLGQALDDLVTYQWAISENGGFESRVDSEANVPSRCFEYVPIANAVPANRHQMLTVVSSVVHTVRRITRGAIDVTALRLPDSLDSGAIGRELRCTVERSEEHLAIVVRERDLSSPTPHRDPRLYELVKHYASELHDRIVKRRTLVGEIQTCIRRRGFVSAKLDAAESDIGLHRRVLQRLLADQGTTFRQLKDETIRDEAVRRLTSGTASITSIAAELGYSEPSAFHRAFQIWFGVTPGEFKQSDLYAG